MNLNSDRRRVAALRALDIIASEPEEGLDRLVSAASRIFATPVAAITLVDMDRLWFKSSIGLNGVTEMSRTLSFCTHTIQGDDVLEIPDLRNDPRFAENPLVTGAPHFRFYAGVPLILEDGTKLGSLCVIDRRPRRLTEDQHEILRDLAPAVISLLLHRRRARQLELASVEAECLATHDGSTKLLNRDGLERLARETAQENEDRQARTAWSARLEAALEENRMVLFAQRIQPLDPTVTGLHAEVLLRMRGPRGHLIPPSAFLPAAQRFKLSARIDRWVLDHAIAWFESTERLDDINTIFLNLSGQSVDDRDFHAWALARLAAAGPKIRRRLCLEITESATITNLSDAAAFIDKLRAQGIRIALDDFGTGASSFSYLKSLNVDFLKIDGQFICDIVESKLDQAAVKCFQEVAKVAGLKTVAEFVHDEAVFEHVSAMKIDYAQGYFIHRPGPLQDLLRRPDDVPDI